MPQCRVPDCTKLEGHNGIKELWKDNRSVHRQVQCSGGSTQEVWNFLIYPNTAAVYLISSNQSPQGYDVMQQHVGLTVYCFDHVVGTI